MAILGRHSKRDAQRVERFNAWFRARPVHAVLSPALGVLSVIDFFTIVLSIPLGVAAIVTGAMGWRILASQPGRPGRWLSISGIVLGVIGLVLTGLFVAFVVR